MRSCRVGVPFFVLQKSQIRVLWAERERRRLTGGRRRSVNRRRRGRACSLSPDGATANDEARQSQVLRANVRRRQAILDEGRGVLGL